jgi:preprotein translocase subunit SecE
VIRIAIYVAVLVALGMAMFHFRQTLLRAYEKTAVFLREVKVEMQKVVWPSRQEVYGATFVVLVSVIILTIAIGIEDRLLTAILDVFLSFAAS